MSKEESYFIRFFHGVKADNEPIHTYKELTLQEYTKLEEALVYKRFNRDIEKAYEFIVFNYRDYELNNYSTVLNHVLLTSDVESMYSAVNGIERHISNILTSTYLYVSLFKFKRKNPKKNDDTFENSRESTSMHELKTKHKSIANKFHKEHYQYTFVSALRNRINHGGDLKATTELGGSWSIRYESLDPEGEDLRPRKDKRYSLFDQKVSKQEAKNIIDNKKHYSAVKDNIPDNFYLREAIRRYVDLVSQLHSEMGKCCAEALNSAEKLVESHLNTEEPYAFATLVKFEKVKEIDMGAVVGGSGQGLSPRAPVKSPLNLEHYIMPGEPSAVPKNA